MTISHHYCVPTALSILTGLPVENVEAELKLSYLGDVQISGIYIGLALKFLSDNGYHWQATFMEGKRIDHFNWGCTYLVEIKGHALVFKEGSVYDNSNLNGVLIEKYARRAERIVRAYRITKDA